MFGKKERNALTRDRARLTKIIQSISYFTGAEIIFSYNKMQNLMVTVMVKVTLTFRVTIKLMVKITVEVTDFYGNGELRLFAATTNTRNPHHYQYVFNFGVKTKMITLATFN